LILYIHGFRTTPRSAKALLLREHYGDELFISDHSFEPDQAIADLETIIRTRDISGIIASSLGGYYATWLADRYQLPSVLINPSVRPFETTRAYLGLNTRQDGTTFQWKEKHLAQLESYYVDPPDPSLYYLFLQTGDEVLDYRIAKERFAGAKMVIEEGGNHRFENFQHHLAKVDAFLLGQEHPLPHSPTLAASTQQEPTTTTEPEISHPNFR
jgi:predicted esterase YcpF (UPF0227 family)